MMTTPAPKSSNRPGCLSQLLGTGAFVTISLFCIWAFLTIFPPSPFEAPPTPYTGYDVETMQANMAPDSVRREVDRIASFGHRFIGDDGFYATEDYIRQRYADAGLDVYEQNIRTAVPQTEYRRAELADGEPAPFDVYPFMPNHFQPVSTPDEGVTGELVLVSEDTILSRSSFQDCIAVIDAAQPPPTNLGYLYTNYARLGFRGLIVTHREGLSALDWDQVDNMTTMNPLNFPRLAATPAVLEHLGDEITLHIRVRYENVANRTLVGVLRSGQTGNREAVIIPVSYDALSQLPDLAPGIPQIIPLAVQLQLLNGLQAYRENLRRDVIFIAFSGRVMARSGVNELLRAVGSLGNRENRLQEQRRDQAENNEKLAAADAVLALFADDRFMQDPEVTIRQLESLSDTQLAFFEAQYQHTLNTLVFDLTEAMLQTKIEFEKGDVSDLESAAYHTYQAAKSRYDKAFSSAGFQVERLVTSRSEFVEDYEVRALLLARFRALQAFHQEQAVHLEQNLALHSLIGAYGNISVLAPEFTAAPTKPQTELISFGMGHRVDEKDHGQTVKDLLLAAINRLDLSDKVQFRHGGVRHGNDVRAKTAQMPLEAQYWCMARYPAYSLLNFDRSYAERGYPVELPYMRDIATLENTLKVTGEAILASAFGSGNFKTLQRTNAALDMYGKVLAANVGQSIIPNYPVQGALLGSKGLAPDLWRPQKGYMPAYVFFTDVYGEYNQRQCLAPFSQYNWEFDMDAVAFDEDGQIVLIKDEGSTAQNVFRSSGLKGRDLSESVNVVCFRASPITILDLINPQNMKKPFSSVELIRRRGLTPFDSLHTYRIGEGMITTFISPDEYFYVKLKAGAPGNDQVQVTRAFMLGITAEQIADLDANPPVGRLGSEINGPGYLANDLDFLLDVPQEIGRSMLYVNRQRLALQQHYRMADERSEEFHENVGRLLELASVPNQPQSETITLSRDAVSYAILNHPVLRANIFEAVIGILWYLGLLVPFVFFFEKLIFGFSDIRKQLTAHGFIFLIVFGLLRVLHPAFAMIRSSLMILLGFVILLISAGIIFLFSSKFKENLENIRKSRGQVSGAEVNKFGAIAIAFMLGLNNMHRRRVRTLLTCGTLVLITFVMICFTSMESDLSEMSQAIGKAPFQGFVVKNEQYRPLSQDNLRGLRDKYGQRYKVVPRWIFAGTEDNNTRERRYPQFEIVRSTDTRNRNASPHSLLVLGADEPLAGLLQIEGRWFTPEQEIASDQPIPLIISNAIARDLDITPEMVHEAPVPVTVSGDDFLVQAIFDASSLEAILDLDGGNLLPFDVKALRQINRLGSQIIADQEDPQIAAENLVITPRHDMGITIPESDARINSIAVVFPREMAYKEARQEIDQYMVQSGDLTYYGLDGYSFMGRRARTRSFVGLLDMLIPLIIAAMTVLNTIRGSVYERRDEIFVYNAVGIAPIHVFFMFFAEAFVYAVVGSVLGYILSQGTGKVLTALELTGGLNMTFTSLSTIFASITIMASVFLSTLFPARTAMKIAAPSEDAGWQLPTPEGDRLFFKLPFTFSREERIGVLAFFNRYFLDHGEGSSGRFFAGKPIIALADHTDPLDNNGYIPEITVPIWLKPFDLGVSQRIEIALPKDEETGEYIAEISIIHQSGTLENWYRLNTPFIQLIRRHFLHWRAVKPDERREMFEEARELLTNNLNRPADETANG